MMMGHLPTSVIAVAVNTQTVEATGNANSSAASFPVSITTLTANAVIVLGFMSNSGSLLTAPTATGAGSLTFTVGSNGAVNGAGYYYALAPTAGVYTITVTPAFASFTTAVVMSVTNSASALFDGAVQVSTSDPLPITTTNANDCVFVIYKPSPADPTTGAGGFTQITSPGNFTYFAYRIVSATGTYTPAMATGAGTSVASITHALKQG